MINYEPLTGALFTPAPIFKVYVINYGPLTGACRRVGKKRRIRVGIRYYAICVYNSIRYNRRNMFL
jgi:hypothetical protein